MTLVKFSIILVLIAVFGVIEYQTKELEKQAHTEQYFNF